METDIAETRDDPHVVPVTVPVEAFHTPPASPVTSRKCCDQHKARFPKRHSVSAPCSPALYHVRDAIHSPVRRGSLGSAYRNAPFFVPHTPPSRQHYHVPLNQRLMPYMLTGFQTSGSPAPRISQVQKAMERAIVEERGRVKKLEEEEETMTVEGLKSRLKAERRRMAKLAAELARHKATTAQAQLEAEMVEEGRVNSLMRRLEELQLEKGRIIHELEREEEMLTNTLQSKLDQVRNEKDQLVKLLHDRAVSSKPATVQEVIQEEKIQAE